MSQELKTIILNVSTGEVIERPFTPEEAAEFEANQLAKLTKETSRQSVRESALAKLSALGLTDEEIAALYCQLIFLMILLKIKYIHTKASHGFTMALLGMLQRFQLGQLLNT